MSSLRLFLLLSATMALLACNRVHVGGDDAGVSDGGAREQCGPVTCGAGQECCNASCGICTEPGGACITLECVDSCSTNADCDATEYCAVQGCPAAGVTGTCVPRPESCDLIYDPVCGCDGRTYGNACGAANMGANVARVGECGGGACGADDARGVGPCDALVGVAWDGASCGSISGCSCEGADCARYSGADPMLDCWRQNASCVGCAADDARGVGECATVVGVTWNGSACVGLSGCSCEGADCGRYSTMAECQAAHASCGACGTNADCSAGEWCRFDTAGQCATRSGGTCTGTPPPGWACDAAGPMVCGCDGNTYECDNHAWASMTSVLHEGPCGTGVCEAQDARGVQPECPAIVGVAFTGTSCVYIGGCGCEGADCGNLYRDLEACEAATGGCSQAPGGSCGGFAETPCRPDEWCDFPDGSFCGGDDSPGVCRPRPENCADIFAPVCGCDGMDYDNGCTANGAGVDVSTMGMCPVPPG